MDAAKFRYFSDRYSSLASQELLELVEKRSTLATEAQIALDAVLRTKGIDPSILERFTENSSARGAAQSKRSERKSVWLRLFYVLMAGWIACLPAGTMSYITMQAASWYVALLVLAHALGGGLLAGFFGVIALIARRDRADGGLRAAIVITVIVSAIVTFFQWYGRSGLE